MVITPWVASFQRHIDGLIAPGWLNGTLVNWEPGPGQNALPRHGTHWGGQDPIINSYAEILIPGAQTGTLCPGALTGCAKARTVGFPNYMPPGKPDNFPNEIRRDREAFTGGPPWKPLRLKQPKEQPKDLWTTWWFISRRFALWPLNSTLCLWGKSNSGFGKKPLLVTQRLTPNFAHPQVGNWFTRGLNPA